MINEISFCIVNTGHSKELLDRCLASIHQQSVLEYEVILCGDTNGVGEDDGIQILDIPESVDLGNFNAVSDLFYKKSTSKFLLFIDANIELAPDWYEKIKNADCFDIAASRINTPEGKRAIDWGYLLQLGDRVIPSPLHYDEWTTKAFVSGSLMLIKRELSGMIDVKQCRQGAGDVDLCISAAEKGFRLGVFEEALATYHPSSDVASRMEHYTFDQYSAEITSYRTAYAEGIACTGSGKYNEAIKYFTTALNIAPNAPDSQGGLGWAKYFNGSYEQAVEEFDKAITVTPKDNYLLRGRGWCYLQMGKHDKAHKDFSLAVKLIKQGDVSAFMESWRGLCWSSYHMERFEEAVSNFETFLGDVEPSDVGVLRDIYSGLGWSLNMSGRYSDALKNFELLIALIDPLDKTALKEALKGRDSALKKLKEEEKSHNRIENNIVVEEDDKGEKKVEAKTSTITKKSNNEATIRIPIEQPVVEHKSLQGMKPAPSRTFSSRLKGKIKRILRI